MGPARKKQRLSSGSAAEVESKTTAPEAQTTTATDAKAPETSPDDAKAKQDQQKRSLFVRSLPATTTSESLTELFSESYPVKHAVAVSDKETKQCKGYGFVTFADAEDAARAKTEFNGKVVDGRKLRVEIAEPRHREGEGENAGEVAKAKREQERAETQQQPRLIVRNLPWTIKNSDGLVKLFQSYGKVKQAYIPKRSGGLLPGFGFVLMRGRKNAEKAIEGVNGRELDGRTLAVDWAVAKEVYNKIGAEEETGAGKADDEEGAAEEELDGEDEDGEDEDDEDDASDEEGEDGTDATSADEEMEHEPKVHQEDDRSSTLFVRNLPFSCTDEDLEDHFSQFGSTRYARVVLDRETERSKGTGFVCFYEKDDTEDCLREAPRRTLPGTASETDKHTTGPSILQNTEADPTGKYTMDGRVLQVTLAVDKSQANRLAEQGSAHRDRRDRDKRRLYLLSEGTIATNTKLWESLPPSEQTMREASSKQRKSLIESNPSLSLSLTRLSIRNLPRSIDSKALKQLAREAVVGFAKDVKAGVRERLSKEELSRGEEEMTAADEARKAAGKGIVRQAKVVFEGEGGGKVKEDSGAGRSRGYGFVEYHTHRSALMGLRWLNGHAVGYRVQDGQAQGKGKPGAKEAIQDKKKRLIVEFAIENAQVVHRRQDREHKARERSKAVQQARAEAGEGSGPTGAKGKPGKKDIKRFKEAGKAGFGKDGNRKRKRGAEDDFERRSGKGKGLGSGSGGAQDPKKPIDDKTAKRNQIIGRKRAMRRDRQGGKK